MTQKQYRCLCRFLTKLRLRPSQNWFDVPPGWRRKRHLRFHLWTPRRLELSTLVCKTQGSHRQKPAARPQQLSHRARTSGGRLSCFLPRRYLPNRLWLDLNSQNQCRRASGASILHWIHIDESISDPQCANGGYLSW